SRSGNELLHQANVADDVVACSTRADFVDVVSGGLSLGRASLFALRKIDDANAQIRITDSGDAGRFGQKAGLGHARDRIGFQYERSSILRKNDVHPGINL